MRIKNKALATFIVAILILFLGYVIYTNSYVTKSVESYLKDNYITADFTKDGISSSLELINDSNNYEVFLTGEYHRASGNEKVNLEMLKYLNKEEGVKYLICEMQYSVISKLNKYIQNGDEELLKETVNLVKERDPQYAGDEYLKFWQGLYEYNKTLPKNRKVQAFGIDMDFISDYTLKEMASLIPNNESSAQIAIIVKNFKEIFIGKVSDEAAAMKALMDLNEDFTANTEPYKALLGENFIDFKNNLSSLMNTMEYAKSQNANRDDLIYNNFMRIYKDNPKGKYYGQFGVNHIFRQDIFFEGNSFFTMARMMEKGGGLKVLSIPIVTSNKMSLVGDADKLAKGNCSIFKLNGKNSPFKEKNEPLFLSSLFGITNGSTADNYQYLIYVKNR